MTRFGYSVPALIGAAVLATALGVAGACFSERQATGPSGSTAGNCTIPIDSPIIGATGAIIAIRNFGFHPQTVTVKAGTTVTWVNCETADVDAHTSTANSGEWDSPFLPPGAIYSHTFGQAGTFDYHCVPHPFMEGAVIVE